jgi:hypothetical protein
MIIDREPYRIVLDWQGGFPTEAALPDNPGLYALTSRRYGDDRTVLYYVGVAADRGLRARWRDAGYPAWLRRLVDVHGGQIHYVIPIERSTRLPVNARTIRDIERTLIWLHVPPANASGINLSTVTLHRHMEISNSGSITPYLLNTIDTQMDWYGLQAPFAIIDGSVNPP